MKRAVILVLRVALACTPTAVGAQRGPAGETSLLVGPSRYELSGSGTGFSANFSSTNRLAGRSLFIEPNIGYFTYRTQFGGRRHYLFPEIGVQLQAPRGAVRPYFGGGFGIGIDTKGGPSQLDPTLHVAAGVRLWVGGTWGIRLEVRPRAVHPWSGHTVDFGFGVTRSTR